jgi:predicted KAP-like P-loop ATPase
MPTLNADHPLTDPAHDLYGHAYFAHTLARGISDYPGHQSLVMGLHGPCGSGKSTVINFVHHHLKHMSSALEPIMVSFQPWCVSGYEDVTHALLTQLQAALPENHAELNKLRHQIGLLIDRIASTHIQPASLPPQRHTKTIPSLKADIAQTLLETNRRIIVTIDDIDRLPPQEICQLLSAIKALADFPHVVYLLALDREVTIHALAQHNGLSGEEYLEKIIQAPFDLPPLDRSALRAALFQRLNAFIEDTPANLVDLPHLRHTLRGLDPLLAAPRDVVRLANALTITYPPVLGEVNPVDFMALEALRLFLPALYNFIRKHAEGFSSYADQHREDATNRAAFKTQWLPLIPEPLQASTTVLLEHLFPKLGGGSYSAVQWRGMRKNLHICRTELFPTYFNFAILPAQVSRKEMLALVAQVDQPQALEQSLLLAAKDKLPHGSHRAAAMVDRLGDYADNDLPPQHITTTLQVLLRAGDQLMPAATGSWAMFNTTLPVINVVCTLLSRIAPRERLDALHTALVSGHGLEAQICLIERLELEAQNEAHALLDTSDIEQLKQDWLLGLEQMRQQDQLLSHPQFAHLLKIWCYWGDEKRAKAWCMEATASNAGMLTFLSRFSLHTTPVTLAGRAQPSHVGSHPSALQKYVDTSHIAQRLRTLQRADKITDPIEKAVTEQFLVEIDMAQDEARY